MRFRTEWQRRIVAVVALTIVAGVQLGCHRDPNVRKARYLASGKKYASQGKEKEAVIQFSNAIKIDPNYAAAHYELAKAYLKLGAPSAAYAELRRTLAADPKNVPAMIDLGDLYLAARKPDDSKKEAEAVLAIDPNNADAYALLASNAMAGGDRAAALTNIQHALSIDPSKSSYHATLGLIQASDPSTATSAEDQLRKAVALDPKNLGAHLILAGMLARKGDTAGAAQQAQAAVDADPTSIRAWTEEAGIYYRSGDKAKAEQVLAQATDRLHDSDTGADLLRAYLDHEKEGAKGVDEYAALVSKYPDSVPLKLSYARLLIEQGNMDKAQQIATSLEKKNGGDPHVALLNGMLLLRAGKADEAHTLLQKAAKDSPDNAGVQFWYAQAQLAKGDPNGAEQSLHTAERLNPASREIQSALVQVSIRNGDFAGLSEIADNVLAKTPNEAEPHLWKGMAALHDGHLDVAQNEFEEALKIDPKNPDALFQMGQLDYKNKKYPEGTALLQQALDLNPNALAALHLLVSYDVYQHQIPKAIALVQAQIAKVPQNSGYYDELAQLQLASKDVSDAAATSEKAMQLNPADGVAVMTYTRAAVASGNVGAAVARWQQWKTKHPNDARADVILGTLAEAQGNVAEAKNDYNAALAIQPDQPVAANNLAYLMLQTGGDVDMAVTLAETARRGMPTSPNTADTLAWAYYQKGIYGSARDLLTDAEHTSPDDASIEYHLGMVYEKMGNKADAATHLKKAASLAPNTQTGAEASKALGSL